MRAHFTPKRGVVISCVDDNIGYFVGCAAIVPVYYDHRERRPILVPQPDLGRDNVGVKPSEREFSCHPWGFLQRGMEMPTCGEAHNRSRESSIMLVLLGFEGRVMNVGIALDPCSLCEVVPGAETCSRRLGRPSSFCASPGERH